MKVKYLRLILLALPVSLLGPEGYAQEAPHGSITIDRIADIKYPTQHAWSPDSKTVAFLWDAAGKQDLFISQGGGAPVALTDFPVDPEILTCDIGAFEWMSAS